MALYASDGSLNIRVNAPGTGLYTPEGYLRIDTLDADPGRYASDGAQRGDVSVSEVAPTPGIGYQQPDGALRLTATGSAYYNQPGVYAKDGSYKVTVNV